MSLNHEELQNLRHLIGAEITTEKKCNFYAENAQDPQCKEMFAQAAKSSSQTYQKLTSFLG